LVIKNETQQGELDMSAAALLLGFLNVLLYCAIIILVAFVIVWVLSYVFGVTLDGNVLKWGKIVVALLCIIAIVAWLLSLIGGGVGYAPHFLGRW
jgi:ABC-type multidrug transport system permease subunit